MAERNDAFASPLQVMVIPVTPIEQNASIVACRATGRAAVVDPGGDVDVLLQAIERAGVTVEKILLTHGHFDHAGGAAELAERLGNVPIEGPTEKDQFLLDKLDTAGEAYGIAGLRPVKPDVYHAEGDRIAIGELTFDVYACPGHTPGHLVYVEHGAKFVLAGDTLFAGTVGRTDFSYGDGPLLVAGIKRVLMSLGDDFTVLPGHGQATTIGRERVSNPYLR